MENLQITITLEKDRKTINSEEKECYLNMTVREFVKDYVNYYESIEEDDE